MNNLAQNNKIAAASVVGMLVIWVFACLPSESVAQTGTGKAVKLSVGTTAIPPFAMKTAGGAWEGLGIELWQAVASAMGAQYEIREYDTFDQLL